MAKITFGMIVKDGMPFVKYSLGCVHEIAHEIIIVDGGSTDGTIEYIKSLDWDNIKLIQGTYKEKNDQANEYMKAATGDWVWVLDSDEVYKVRELYHVSTFLNNVGQDVNILKLKIINFFRNLDTVVIGGLWSVPVNRIFRHKQGDLFHSHRPLSILREGKVITPNENDVVPQIYMYHYSHVGIDRVRRKAMYYAENLKNHPVYSKYVEWFNKVYMNKNIVNNLHITGDGHCVSFTGEHPNIIIEAIKRGELNEYRT
jgi:glycosyltransferase involved in cell wall biosynthesis